MHIISLVLDLINLNHVLPRDVNIFYQVLSISFARKILVHYMLDKG